MLKIELELGDNDGSHIGVEWVDCPPLEHVSDEEWNQNLLVWDQVKNGIHALLGNLGPIPPEGWKIRFWLDAKKFPESVVKAANTDHWETRGFVGPPPNTGCK